MVSVPVLSPLAMTRFLSQSNMFDWDKNLVIAKGDNTGTDTIGDWLAVPDGSSHRAWGGLYGRFTERLVLNLSGGYARFVYDEASVVDYVSSIGDLRCC